MQVICHGWVWRICCGRCNEQGTAFTPPGRTPTKSLQRVSKSSAFSDFVRAIGGDTAKAEKAMEYLEEFLRACKYDDK